VQLKGSGLTPYSRMGDGRAVLRSSIREFLCSEAMHALGIPTTRALCVVGSRAGAAKKSKPPPWSPVWRPASSASATSSIFQRAGNSASCALADFVIDRFYPACRETGAFDGNPYAALLEAVSGRTAAMVAQWQAVGFCHGVMNTDNMSILGLTIDYGPFQFLDAFDPGHICNHSDPGPLRLQPPAQHRLLEPVLPGPGAAAADRRTRPGHGCAGTLQDRLPARTGCAHARQAGADGRRGSRTAI
jgi:uncharacterized protein YdiU (UPF0061 family)